MLFCESNCKNVLLYLKKKREQSTDSDVAFKTNRDFFKLQQDYGHRVFFPAVVSNVTVFSCILFILLSRESDQSAVRAR